MRGDTAGHSVRQDCKTGWESGVGGCRLWRPCGEGWGGWIFPAGYGAGKGFELRKERPELG